MKQRINFLIVATMVYLTTQAQLQLSDLHIPEVGKWMETRKGLPASWLGRKYMGAKLLEPINVIILDEFATTKEASIHKLVVECKRNGYYEEGGHSAGYLGIIDNNDFPQIPYRKRYAFADHNLFRTNNHGRIMGPDGYQGKFIYVAAFSRETFHLFSKIHHAFLSFQTARDDFSRKLTRGNTYRLVGYCFLDNQKNEDGVTTADHNGYAAVLAAVR